MVESTSVRSREKVRAGRLAVWPSVAVALAAVTVAVMLTGRMATCTSMAPGGLEYCGAGETRLQAGSLELTRIKPMVGLGLGTQSATGWMVRGTEVWPAGMVTV